MVRRRRKLTGPLADAFHELGFEVVAARGTKKSPVTGKNLKRWAAVSTYHGGGYLFYGQAEGWYLERALTAGKRVTYDFNG